METSGSVVQLQVKVREKGKKEKRKESYTELFGIRNDYLQGKQQKII